METAPKPPPSLHTCSAKRSTDGPHSSQRQLAVLAPPHTMCAAGNCSRNLHVPLPSLPSADQTRSTDDSNALATAPKPAESLSVSSAADSPVPSVYTSLFSLSVVRRQCFPSGVAADPASSLLLLLLPLLLPPSLPLLTPLLPPPPFLLALQRSLACCLPLPLTVLSALAVLPAPAALAARTVFSAHSASSSASSASAAGAAVDDSSALSPSFVRSLSLSPALALSLDAPVCASGSVVLLLLLVSLLLLMLSTIKACASEGGNLFRELIPGGSSVYSTVYSTVMSPRTV